MRQINDLKSENHRLRKAFHDAIRRPMGVVPESGEEFYDPTFFGDQGVESTVLIDTCGRRWVSSATEIEGERGKRREWREI